LLGIVLVVDMTTRRSTLNRLLLALTLALPLACGDDGITKGPTTSSGDEVGETGETGGDRPDEVCKSSCQECANLMKDAYACMPFDESEEPLADFECIVCDNDGPGTAALTCETQANLQSVIYATMEAQIVACDDSMVAAKCTGWSPNRQIHPRGANQWDVERDFIEALVADPSQLVGCDDARVKSFFGSYRLTSVDSDDLLGRLGLMNDDVIQSINGYSMSGPSAVALAFFNLWPDTRVFTVTVLRPGVGALTFTYNLV
jgi:hypothetical protein